MREILFRGKSLETSEWVCGGYSSYDVRYLSDGPIINENDGCENIVCPSIINYDDDCLWVRVVPETVGQWTGTIDVNDQKIFDGDIVKVMTKDGLTTIGEVIYGNDGSVRLRVVDMEAGGRYAIVAPLLCLYEHIEVLGNVHDNPELLEVDR